MRGGKVERRGDFAVIRRDYRGWAGFHGGNLANKTRNMRGRPAKGLEGRREVMKEEHWRGGRRNPLDRRRNEGGGRGARRRNRRESVIKGKAGMVRWHEI